MPAPALPTEVVVDPAPDLRAGYGDDIMASGMRLVLFRRPRVQR